MKYIFFVSREPWASFNSLYAYVKSKGVFPSQLMALYNNEENMKKVDNMLKILYSGYGKNLELKKIKIPDDVEDMRKIILEHVEENDIVDITGARKFSILSLLGMKNVHVIYLYLQDMQFSSLPFMMRPYNLQKLMEVDI